MSHRKFEHPRLGSLSVLGQGLWEEMLALVDESKEKKNEVGDQSTIRQSDTHSCKAMSSEDQVLQHLIS